MFGDGGSREPGILEKTRQLKRTRISDSLNEKLSQRPGPLELVQDNILHVDGGLEQAVKEGLVQFKPTSAGMANKHPQPVFLVQEMDGPSQPPTLMIAGPMDSGRLSHSGNLDSFPSQPKPNKFKKPKPNQPVPSPLAAKQYSEPGGGSNSSGKNKIIKFHEYKGPRSVGGWQGSPEMGDVQPPTPQPEEPKRALLPSEETSYDLLLQQQQLFLQWQLELQAKYPGHNIQLLPLPPSSSAPSLLFGNGPSSTALLLTPHQPPSPNSSTSVSSTSPYSITGEPSPAALPPPNNLLPLPQQPVLPMAPPEETQGGSMGQWREAPSTPAEAEEAAAPPPRKPPQIIRPPILRLEDLRVSELKAQCKKRGFPVSGPKPNLVERLRAVEEEVVKEVRDTIAAEAQELREQQQPAPVQESGSWEQGCSNPETSGDYPSPGIDLSQLSFSQSQPQVSTSFTFAAQGSGGQFTALPTNPGFQQPLEEAEGEMESERAPTPAALHPQPPQPQRLDNLISPTVISSSTLSLHEEMLRHQQRKIEELQKELQRSQEQLRHQQALIVAARKAQAEGTEGEGKSAAESVADAWLAHIDTKHLQRFHIQLFLHHKIQQQQMQSMLATARKLWSTHEELGSGVKLESALDQVRALLAADPTTAFAMLHSLKNPPEEDVVRIDEPESSPWSGDPSTSTASVPPPPKKILENADISPDEEAQWCHRNVDLIRIRLEFGLYNTKNGLQTPKTQ